MHLTRLRLRGFKSFCEPTELAIAPGLTGIVGPNGCGKSNLVDALRWVMGEGSPKGLRGAEMDDVIFGGSAARAAFDIAEVALGIEGPVDGPLVLAPGEPAEIIRRLARGAGSSWRIDGREVRARDVHHLLADAAAGARGAAIVGQGQIGLLVDSRPDERRRLLEEAAGIAGLQARRREAELRLRQTEANLVRVQDLVASRAERLRELERQAREAERYRKLSADLRAVEATLLLRRHAHAREALRRAAAELDDAGRAEALARAGLERARDERARLAAGLAEARGELERAAAEAARLAERLAAARARRAELEREREERARRRAEALADLAALEAEAGERERRAVELEATLRALDAERAGRAAETEAARRAGAVAVDRERSAAAARERALEARLAAAGAERLGEERARLETRLARLAEALAEDRVAAADERAAPRAALASATAALATTGERVEAAERVLAAAEPAVEAARRALALAAEQLSAARAAQAAVEAERSARAAARRERAERRALLEGSRDANRARRDALEAELAATLALLARIRPEELARALEAAAEASATAAARAAGLEERRGRAEAALAQAVAALHEAETTLARLEAGRAALGPAAGGEGEAAIVRRVRGAQGLEAALAAALGEEGLAGTDPGSARHWRRLADDAAGDLLPDGVEPLAARLDAPPELARRLARTGLCAAGRAAELQARLLPGQRLVSPEGGLWRWDGYVQQPGADAHSRRLALLARLDVLDREHGQAVAALAAARAAHGAALAGLDQATAEARAAAAEAVERARAEVEARRALAEAEAAGARAEATRAGLAAELERLAAEDLGLAARLAAMAETAEEADPAGAATAEAGDPAALEAAWVEARDRLAGLEAERQAAMRQLAEARAAAAEARAEHERARAALERAERTAAARAAERAALAGERAAIEARLAPLIDEIARAEPVLVAAERALQAAETELAEAAGERARAGRREAELAVAVAALESRLEAGRAERARLAGEQDGLAERQEGLRQRLARLAEGGPPQVSASDDVEALAKSEAAAAAAHARAVEQTRALAAAIDAAERDLDERESSLAALRERLALARAAAAAEESRVEEAHARVVERLRCPPEAVPPSEAAGELAGLPVDELERRLARLVAGRDRLGAVNLRAEQEAQDLARELERTRAEEAEIRTACERLGRAIATVNREARERLLAVLEAVEGHFSRLVVELFGGGRGQLRLTDPGDPLAAGLELEAQPPGKRLAHVSLLSGGEKSLAGLALVLAFFLARPAPLCVLDEVDAPLDDANVDRFTSLVAETSRRTGTRFLVVTHHPLTMARMDRLYGVTMAERGVSRLVSVELARAVELRATA